MQLNVDPKFDEALKALAKKHDFISIKKKGNVTKLIQAIAAGEIPLGERQHIIDAPWLTQIKEFIGNKQPFAIHYKDVTGKDYYFEATYADLVWREKRQYLEIYSPNLLENYESDNIPGLKNNRCFRLDRIDKNAGVHWGVYCVKGERQTSSRNFCVILARGKSHFSFREHRLTKDFF